MRGVPPLAFTKTCANGKALVRKRTLCQVFDHSPHSSQPTTARLAAFILPSRGRCKRPGLAHLFGGALANDIGFLRAWEDLRWGQDTSSTKHDGRGGRLTWKRGVEAGSLAPNIAASIGSTRARLTAG